MQTQQYIEEQNTKMININEETLPLAIQKDIEAYFNTHSENLKKIKKRKAICKKKNTMNII